MGRLRVRDLMTDGVFTLRPGDDLAAVHDLMDTRHVRHVPIVDDDGDLQGLVSHRDLARSILGQASRLPISNQRQLLHSTRVDEIMRQDIETVDPNTELREAGQTILENKFGCLPVVDNGHLVGILTEADFVRYVVEGMRDERS